MSDKLTIEDIIKYVHNLCQIREEKIEEKKDLTINEIPINSSLLISIFTALISGFKDISYDDKVFYLKKYIAVFTSELKKKNIYIKYTTDNNIIDKKIIMKDIKNYEKIENFNNFIVFLTMFFDVNIFIIDNDDINLYSINYYFNIFKYSIILKKIAEDKYNIIKFNNETLFSYINNEEFKNFIDVKTQQIKSFKQNSRLEYITDNFIIQYDKDIEHYENSFSSIQEINKSKMYKNKKCVEEKQENTQTDIQTDTQEEIKGTMTEKINQIMDITYTYQDLKNMNLIQLKSLTKQNKLKVTNSETRKPYTKNELIDNLLKYINA